jgi:hypothetical protein
MFRENPFPGMNPWMQNVWHDLHVRLISYIADALCEELPEDLVARAEENVSLSGEVGEDEEKQQRRPDVVVVDDSESWKHGVPPVWTPENDRGLADRVAKPVLVETQAPTPRWIEIRADSGDLITVIEVTSPANKTSSGRATFEQKVANFLHGGVSVMEIDLIRGGRAARDARIGNWPEDPCQIIVDRGSRTGLTEVYPCPLREPIPVVRVPLRRGEPDAALDVQALIDRCYARGRYWKLKYQQSPVPELGEADLIWAQARLREVGLLDGEA